MMGQLGREAHAGRVAEAAVGRGEGQLAHLVGCRIRQLAAAVADVDVPERGQAVDVLAAGGVG